MNAHMMLLSTFAAVSLGVLGLAGLLFDMFFRQKARIDARLKQEFRDQARERAKESPLFRDLASLAAETVATQPTLQVRLQIFLTQAGVHWNVLQFSLLSAMAGFTLALLIALATRFWPAVVPAGLIGAAAPLVYVYTARKKRMARLCQQQPEAFEVMGRAMRAGQTVQTAFQVVANEFPSPISEEFAYCFEQQHLGIAYEATLRDFARRTGFVETQIFATALIINRQVGGNLAEVLARLAATLRKRAHFQSRVRALTGEGRMQAVVLTALPAAAFVALLVLQRDYVQVLLDRPWLLAGTIGAQVLGALCIHKITNLKF